MLAVAGTADLVHLVVQADALDLVEFHPFLLHEIDRQHRRVGRLVAAEDHRHCQAGCREPGDLRVRFASDQFDSEIESIHVAHHPRLAAACLEVKLRVAKRGVPGQIDAKRFFKEGFVEAVVGRIEDELDRHLVFAK